MMDTTLKLLAKEVGSTEAALDSIDEHHRKAIGSADTCIACSEITETTQYVLTSAVPQKVRIGIGPLQWLLLFVGMIGVQVTTDFRNFHSEWSLCRPCRRKVTGLRGFHGLIYIVCRVTLFFALFASMATGGYMLFINDLNPEEFSDYMRICAASTAIWIFVAVVLHKTQNLGYSAFGVLSRPPFQCTALEAGTLSDVACEAKST